jgi:hypothetical protein
MQVGETAGQWPALVMEELEPILSSGSGPRGSMLRTAAGRYVEWAPGRWATTTEQATMLDGVRLALKGTTQSAGVRSDFGLAQQGLQQAIDHFSSAQAHDMALATERIQHLGEEQWTRVVQLQIDELNTFIREWPELWVGIARYREPNHEARLARLANFFLDVGRDDSPKPTAVLLGMHKRKGVRPDDTSQFGLYLPDPRA